MSGVRNLSETDKPDKADTLVVVDASATSVVGLASSRLGMTKEVAMSKMLLSTVGDSQGSKKACGRPGLYTEALGLEICERLACGKSLRTVCKMADMPNMATVTKWLSADPEFREQYARARAPRGTFGMRGRGGSSPIAATRGP